MTTKLFAGLASACLFAAGLSGCGTLGNAPANLAPVIDSLANAGCSGDLSFSIGAGSAAGLSPGAFHAENTFHGSCDPSRIRANSPTPAPTPPVPK